MERIFGFDIGTTSIGFAVIDHDPQAATGTIHHLGVRIFPEARDPDGTPLNQQRRQKRMARRQLRRRRRRRRLLNEQLHAAGMLPTFGSPAWDNLMRLDPYCLRNHGLSSPLSLEELGRAFYHLAQRRHFRGRELGETTDDNGGAADEVEAQTDREAMLARLRADGVTLGTWLARKAPHERRRGVHAHRSVIQDEFERLWQAQAPHHAILRDGNFKAAIADTIFAQRPVFWRKSTLGTCRFVPGAPLCPKGSWLSQQRRMLEKLNNLEIAGGNARPLDAEERAAILARLQTAPSLTWPKVRDALKPLYKARGEPGAERSLRFNLELGGDARLLGNPIEARLADIIGAGWVAHPHRQALREAVPERLREADYGEIGNQRVVIRSEAERRVNRAAAEESFVADFGLSPEQAKALAALSLPAGWEPYSTVALRAMLPHLEMGVRFGALTVGPDWEDWRNVTFPKRERPTGEIVARLPSPASKEEARRISGLRNPTVVRTQNELRKVVNNLIDLFGRPDRIRIEVAREVGLSKRDREERQAGMRRLEARRRKAAADLAANGIAEPSRDDIEKWLLWEESGRRCPYTGDTIGFDALFREGLYEVEHIWPRSRSFDDGIRNKTLCRRDINRRKHNRTPFEAFGHDPEMWRRIQTLLGTMVARRGAPGMPPGKVKRFLAAQLADDFAARQLVDTGYAARQAVALLKRLWPDIGPAAPVNVEPVAGRVTAQLRRLWGLNNVLAEDGEKTRADHRHHAIDALTVACTHPGMTSRLSRYWQQKDDPRAERPELPPPWPTIRADAERAVAGIIVSHRVRKKVSGPLHKETVYGDTGEEITTKSGTYRLFVTRKPVESLTKGEISEIRDGRVRRIVAEHVTARGGDPKKAFPPYPTLGPNGPEIRKVRLTMKQQVSLMAAVSTGYSDLGANHHIAIYRRSDGKAAYEVVSLYEAARRLARREPVVRRNRDDGASFVMSLSPGDMLHFRRGDRQGYRVVQGVWASGVIVTLDHTDAAGTSVWRPTAGSIGTGDVAKVSVDPIGRVRPARD